MTTSRVARKPVTIPSGVEAKMSAQILAIKGPKGTINMDVHPYVIVNIENGTINVECKDAADLHITGQTAKLHRSVAGCTRARIANSVEGVSKGYERKLVLIGVGYRAAAKGRVLNLTVGYSHLVDIDMPDGITIETPIQTEVIVKGIDKDLVGQVAAKIRAVRPPEPYKGKGIRYADEDVVRKETKKK